MGMRISAGRAQRVTDEDIPDLETCLSGDGGRAVALLPDTDLEALAPHLSGLARIEVRFPAFADGRGFSIARQLRGHYRYAGELIAAGPLIPDQYVQVLQCGFDAVNIDPEIFARQSEAEWRNALEAFELTYQRGYAIANGPAVSVFAARRAARAQTLSGQYKGLSAEAALEKAIIIDFQGDIALSSSMGVDSAILLHMISRIEPDLPILFLETGKHFTETLDYRDMLRKRFGLTNLVSETPDAAEIAVQDPADILYAENKDACCDLRKVRPLERAISGYRARITGRKRYQTPNRVEMPILETDGLQIILNPLAFWSARDVTTYIRKHDLPPHPLLSKGYLSIGCAPCTTPVRPGEDVRAGRWRDNEKEECGIHFIDGKWVRTPQPPTTMGDYI